MSSLPAKRTTQNSAPSQAEKRRSIEDQVSQFLKHGGKIESIPNGASGQVWKSPRDAVAVKKPAAE